MPETTDKGTACTRCNGTGRQSVTAFDPYTKKYERTSKVCTGCWGHRVVKTHQRLPEIVAFGRP